MGRQWNQIIDSLGPLTGGTMSINANLTDIEALLTTLQADVADGIIVTTGSVAVTNGTIARLTTGSVAVTGGTISQLTTGSVTVTGGTISQLTAGSVAVTGGTLTTGTTFAGQSTSGGTGPTTFTSTSYGTVQVSNANRRGLTIFNEGSGNLHVTLGTATTSTSSYSVRLASGDYYETPANYTGLVGGIFATAGTARVTEIT